MPVPPGSNRGDQGSFEPDTCRPLREYLHPPRQTTPSCIVLPVNHHRFNLKLALSNCCPPFMGWILKILTLTRRSLRTFVELAWTKLSMRMWFD